LASPVTADWRDGGIPMTYRVQCWMQAIACGTDYTWLVAFIGGRGLRTEKVELDRFSADIIIDIACKFWQHVLNDTPPTDIPVFTPPRHATREKQEVLQSEPLEFLVSEVYNLREQLRVLEEKERMLREALADKEGTLVIGAHKVILSRTRSSRFDSSRFRAEHPDVYEKYQAVIESVRMRIVPVED
ncbi:MAG: hypothetical protein ACPL7O_08450, partial [Armatimonadota bacterium]